MSHDTMRYEKTDDACSMILHFPDRECRNVSFASLEDAAAALLDGRARADCVAVGFGMLPRGAVLVDGATFADGQLLMNRKQNAGSVVDDPLGLFELGFRRSVVTNRRATIDKAADARARRECPPEADRYEMLVDVLEHLSDNADLG